MPVPDFLRTEETLEIPVGAAFAPSGFIGQWAAHVYYSFWTEVDFPKEEYGWDKRRQTGAGNFWYYFTDRAKATAAYEETGGEYNASPTWEWAAKSSSILNWRGEDAMEDTFGPFVSRESAIRTLRSKKQRHELHMLSLPAAVAAMATAYGYDHPGFPLDELLRPEEDVLWTDDFQRDIIGNSDVGYADSFLWKRRAELFKALGEPDARNWQPMAAGTRWDTTSEKLHNCLAVLHSPWKAPIWASVLFVWDPRVDAIYQSGNTARRLTRPCLMKIYASKDEAQKAAAEELGTEGTLSPTRAATGEPALPSAWEGLHDEWIDQMAALKAEFGGELPPLPRIAGRLKDELAVTYDDVKAWWGAI